MNTLFPKTVEEWCAKKRQFLRLLNQTDDPRMAQDYENAINFCDRGAIVLCKIEVKRKRIEELKTRIRHRIKYAVIAISIAVILAILFLSGCQFISGTGTAIKGLGGDIEWVAEGYMEQMK